MPWLDTFLFGYRTVQSSGAASPERKTLNFVGGSVSDNPVNESTDVVVGGGGSSAFADVASLRLSLVPAGGAVASLAGKTAAGDGGGGLFVWDSTSTAADDGALTVQITGHASGRWERIVETAYNVKWFGALGNDSHDDTTSIQAAVDAINARESGSLFFPQGVYKVTSTVVLKEGVRIVGERANYQNDPTPLRGSWIRWRGGSTGVVLDIDGLQDVSIERMGFHGSLQTGVTLVDAYSTNSPPSYNFRFSECYFAECNKGLVIGHGGFPQVDNWLVTHCQFVNMFSYGIEIDSGNAFDDSRIDNCRFIQIGIAHIEIKHAGFFTIADCSGGGNPSTFIHMPDVNLLNTVLIQNCQSEAFNFFIDAAGTNDAITITMIANTPDAICRFDGLMRVVGIANICKFPVYYSTSVRISGFNDRYTNDAIPVVAAGAHFFNIKPINGSYYNERQAAGEIELGGSLAISNLGKVFGQQIISTGHTAQYWIPSQAYPAQTYIRPSINNGHVYAATNSGTTGLTEPTWPTGTSSTVVDGTITWLELGPLAERSPFAPLGHSVASAAPTAGYYHVGNVVWNDTPGPMRPSFWSCVAAGNPGTWTATYLGEEIGPNIASAAVITPTHPVHFVTGTTTIQTIIAPADFLAANGGHPREVTLIPTGVWPYDSSLGGNIATIGTGVVNVPLTFRYDPTTTVWFVK